MVRADEVVPDLLREAFNAAYGDYLIRLPTLDANGWSELLRRHAVDLASSVAVMDRDEVGAFALVGAHHEGRHRRRLVAMGARPNVRGTGAAPALLDRVLVESGGDEFELEVFAQNERALRLYRSRGFVPVAELHGYRYEPRANETEALAPTRDATHPDRVVVSIDEAARWLEDVRELPLQISGPWISSSTAPLVAWRRGRAQLVFHDRDTEITVVSLVDRGAEQVDARALVRALRCHRPGAVVHVPNLQPEACGGRALVAAGFARLDLYQLLMRRTR